MNQRKIFESGQVPVARSGWTQPQGPTHAYPALATEIDTDVAIVGAGLAGSALALHLAEAGVRVAVLEARQPGWGASGRNAGHVLPILKDLRVLDGFPDGGKRFLDIFREHHTIPFDLAAKHGIDCDAVRSGYLNGMCSRGAFDKFLAQSAHLEAQGLQKLTRYTAAEMEAATGSSHYPYGVAYENGGRINPYRFTNGMIAAAEGLGAEIFGDSEALTLVEDGARWRVTTARGCVRADRVVFCTNAYPTDIVPAFARAYYPLTAYALTTKPLPPEARDLIMPGGATFAQAPIDLNPLVRDRHDRLILSSIPRAAAPEDGIWHFKSQLRWIHRVWPETRAMNIELDQYWTGRVGMRPREFPGVFEHRPGVYGLMHFNAWGNVMAPLMGMLLADGLRQDRIDTLPFPVERAEPVRWPGKQHVLIRRILIPAARTAQRFGGI